MSTLTVDPAQYEGKKVSIKLADEAEAFDATCEAANAKAVMFKRKGKANVEFKNIDEIEKIELQDDAEPVVKARRLDLVTLSNIKRHLVDRHGYAVADVNAMKSADALAFHEGIDHTPLGHFHAVKPAKDLPGDDE